MWILGISVWIGLNQLLLIRGVLMLSDRIIERSNNPEPPLVALTPDKVADDPQTEHKPKVTLTINVKGMCIFLDALNL